MSKPIPTADDAPEMPAVGKGRATPTRAEREAALEETHGPDRSPTPTAPRS